MIDKGQWREFGQDTGVTPLLFTRSAMGFLVTTESQDLGLTSHPKDGAFYSIVSPSLYWGIRTHTDHSGEHPLLASLTPLPNSMACFSQVIWHGGPNQRSSCQLWLMGSGLGISALDGWAVHTYKQFTVSCLWIVGETRATRGNLH